MLDVGQRLSDYESPGAPPFAAFEGRDSAAFTMLVFYPAAFAEKHLQIWLENKSKSREAGPSVLPIDFPVHGCSARE